MCAVSREPMFENRYEAGRQLAAKLADYHGKPVVVLAIPNGGVPIALSVAMALEADLDLVISRKIPLPLMPEGGCGAVTDDGTIILNEEVVRQAGLTSQQVEHQVSRVRMDIRKRSLLYHQDRPLAVVSGRTAILVDDGLASGFTMVAAVKSLRNRRPKEIIVAVPVGQEAAVKQLEETADKVVACAVSSEPKFYIADFYQYWQDISDEETLQCLREWRAKRPRPGIAPRRS